MGELAATSKYNLDPVVTVLSDVAARVDAAWMRTGVCERDRQCKWEAFIEASLLPLLRDFLTLSETEERNISLENDRLLRELIYFCSCLKESPQIPELSHCLDIFSQKYDAEQLYVQCPEDGDSTVTIKNHVSSGDDDNASANSAFIPSFMHWTLEQQQSQDMKQPFGTVESNTNVVRQLTSRMTHSEIQTRLQAECERLNMLAENRLFLLRLLYKQRMLLQYSAAEQTVIRKQYAEKYVDTYFYLPNSSSIQKSGESIFDGSYHSALSSMKSSIHGISSIENNEQKSNGTADSVAFHQQNGTKGIFKDNASNNDQKGNRVNYFSENRKDEEELHLLIAAPSFYDNSKSSLCLQPRCTTIGSPQHDRGYLSCDKADTTQERGTALELDAADCHHVPSQRDTIFDVDTNEVDKFGKRQDLSMNRIQTEADDIIQRINAENARMAKEVECELDCLRVLYLEFIRNKDCLSGDSKSLLLSSQLPFSLQEIESRVSMLCTDFDRAKAAISNSERQSMLVSSTRPTISSHPTSSSSRCHTTPPVSDLVIADSKSYLPLSVRRTLTALSFAPILAYVVNAREQLQQCIALHYAQSLMDITTRLKDGYQCYYTVTRDTHFAAVAEDILSECNNVESKEGNMPKFSGAAGCFESFCAHVKVLSETLQRQQHHISDLEARLQILAQVPPLLEQRAHIIEEERAMKDGARERLMSRKVNMAKQLLHEEAVRKRVAKELPLIKAALREVNNTWKSLPRLQVGDNCMNTKLCVNGVDVESLLQEEGQCGNPINPGRCTSPFRSEKGRSRPITVSPPPATRFADTHARTKFRQGQISCTSLSRSPPPQSDGNKTPSQATKAKPYALHTLSQQRINQPIVPSAHTTEAMKQVEAGLSSRRRTRSPSVFERLASPSPSQHSKRPRPDHIGNASKKYAKKE